MAEAEGGSARLLQKFASLLNFTPGRDAAPVTVGEVTCVLSWFFCSCETPTLTNQKRFSTSPQPRVCTSDARLRQGSRLTKGPRKVEMILQSSPNSPYKNLPSTVPDAVVRRKNNDRLSCPPHRHDDFRTSPSHRRATMLRRNDQTHTFYRLCGLCRSCVRSTRGSNDVVRT